MPDDTYGWCCFFCGCRISGIPTLEMVLEISKVHACPEGQKQQQQITEMHRLITGLSRRFTEMFGVEQTA